MLVHVFTHALGLLEPAAPAESPPIQRPRSLEQPSAPAPAPVESPPVTPPPVEPTPPTEVPTQVEPPPPLTPPPTPTTTAPTTPAPTPAPATASPFDPSPPPPLPGGDDQILDDAPPPLRPIAPAFRRPGVWVATGASLFALSTILRFIFPTVTRRETRCIEDRDCPDHALNGAGIAILILQVPIDAVALMSLGFAGRSYGLREARRTDVSVQPRRRRGAFIGAGVPFAVAGGVLTLAGIIRPLVKEDPDVFSYEIAAVRQAGAVAGAVAAVLIGYGVALPRKEYANARSERRFAISPTFSRSYAGFALTFRR